MDEIFHPNQNLSDRASSTLPRTKFWAKTLQDGRPGISVRDHCLNVGCVAEALINAVLPAVRALLPNGVVTLAALDEVGKITIGFQAKCPQWLANEPRPKYSLGEVTLSVSDHALVSQICYKNFQTPRQLAFGRWRWAPIMEGRKGKSHASTPRKPSRNGRRKIAYTSGKNSWRCSVLCQ